MPKVRRAFTSRAGRMRFTLTLVAGTDASGGPAPGLQGSNSLPVRGPTACDHL